MSGGLIDTVLDASHVTELATAGGLTYAVMGDGFVWLRGTNSVDHPGWTPLPQHDRNSYYRGDELLLTALEKLGFYIRFCRQSENSSAPVLTLHRHNNAFIYSGYAADTTVETEMYTALGIPVLAGGEVLIRNGKGRYRFARFERRECRVFVEHATGEIMFSVPVKSTKDA